MCLTMRTNSAGRGLGLPTSFLELVVASAMLQLVVVSAMLQLAHALGTVSELSHSHTPLPVSVSCFLELATRSDLVSAMASDIVWCHRCRECFGTWSIR